MPIKKRDAQPTSPVTSDEDVIAKKAEEFGRGGYAPEVQPTPLDPNAPVGPQGILFRFNDYQKQLLKEEAEADRRSQQKLLESIIWPELERRRAARTR
ncbi:hypothetical protein CVCC1112_4263 [Paenarthrobacter nicotinovorans]|uniref:hypothetical protein n=1 Tax=Paenarthrobacter nicotinovorans TaxID=29320 RepID=UPI0007CBC85E|nr:hypothetical protein [Paenarthrobacter nicotinovorans]GAT89604.1 hypothetical protein CVCC1112_4263 [Paenarthrobacter nicotinovorans]